MSLGLYSQFRIHHLQYASKVLDALPRIPLENPSKFLLSQIYLFKKSWLERLFNLWLWFTFGLFFRLELTLLFIHFLLEFVHRHIGVVWFFFWLWDWTIWRHFPLLLSWSTLPVHRHSIWSHALSHLLFLLLLLLLR